MEQNTETKTETKLKPEEMPEYQDKLSQYLIQGGARTSRNGRTSRL